MKIYSTQNPNFPYIFNSKHNNIIFGSSLNNDTFSAHGKFKSVKEYDDAIEDNFVKLQNAMDQYGYFDLLLSNIKTQLSNINKLENFEPVEFKKASTLDEAKKFAIDTFHFKQFNVEDLPTANFINSALTHLLNLSHGNIFMPATISVAPISDESTKGEYKTLTNEIIFCSSEFNDKFIIDSDEEIKNMSYWEYTKYEAFINALKRVIFHELGHCNHYSNKACNESKQDIQILSSKINELRNQITEYNELIRRYQEEREKLNKKLNPLTEMFKHIKSMTLADDINKKQIDNTFSNPNTHEFKDIKPQLPWGEKEKATALLISAYAKTDREEFVAETFAKMCIEDTLFLNKDVIRLYTESGGIMFR